MTAEGRLEEEGGGYVLTTASRAQFVVQNFYFNEAAIKQVSDVLPAPGDRKRFRISGYRAAIPAQNVFEPRCCIDPSPAGVTAAGLRPGIVGSACSANGTGGKFPS